MEKKELTEISISNALKMLFSSEDFRFVSGGTLTGESFLRVASIIEGTFEEDFMLFDNAGGKAFDVVINLEEYPDRVKNFTKALLKENPSWVLAYKIDGKETVTKTLNRKLYELHKTQRSQSRG